MAQLQFKGKPFVQNYHQLVKYHQLVPRKDKSLTREVSLKDNLIIHGDNLAALKALMPQYAGKVKCIYIDPPYNTGNEGWVYNDNLSSPMMQEWLGKVVDREDLTRHDKWLCMMTPRLKLLKELLREDGVIFISIDDNEVHHLRMLMDEIFGEDNFIANFVWQKKYAASNDAKGVAVMHDHILAYSRSDSFERNLLPRTEKQDRAYRFDDKDGKGLWRPDNLLVKSFSESYVFPITNPETGKKFLPQKGSCWRGNKETIDAWIKEGRIFFGKDGKGAPQLKRYLNEVQAGVVPLSWLSFDVAGHNDEANKELKEIFSEKAPFETPKPTRLLKLLIHIATKSNEDQIILDSFGGSGTTAHAVLAMNRSDGGNRKFVLVEHEDYADRITAERVRRVIKGVPGAKDEILRRGLGGSFSYFDLGAPIDVERLLTGKGGLPSYAELARYLFYTATGEEFDEKALNPSKNFMGESKTHALYLFYEPNLEKLKNIALGLDDARALKAPKDKRLMVFAPTKYLDQGYLDQYKIDFVQLPYEIYKAFG